MKRPLVHLHCTTLRRGFRCRGARRRRTRSGACGRGSTSSRARRSSSSTRCDARFCHQGAGRERDQAVAQTQLSFCICEHEGRVKVSRRTNNAQGKPKLTEIQFSSMIGKRKLHFFVQSCILRQSSYVLQVFLFVLSDRKRNLEEVSEQESEHHGRNKHHVILLIPNVLSVVE